MNTTDAIMSLVDEIDCDEPPKDFETHMERRAAIRASIDALVKERDEAVAARNIWRSKFEAQVDFSNINRERYEEAVGLVRQWVRTAPFQRDQPLGESMRFLANHDERESGK